MILTQRSQVKATRQPLVDSRYLHKVPRSSKLSYTRRTTSQQENHGLINIHYCKLLNYGMVCLQESLSDRLKKKKVTSQGVPVCNGFISSTLFWKEGVGNINIFAHSTGNLHDSSRTLCGILYRGAYDSIQHLIVLRESQIWISFLWLQDTLLLLSQPTNVS